MAPPEPRDWTIGSVARSILADVRVQPVALILALTVAPTVWYLPAAALHDAVVSPSGSDASVRSIVVHILVMAVTTVWWGMVYAGQLQVAIDVARGGRVQWSRFPRGLRHTGRVAVTALPCMLPLGAVIVLPDAPWLDPWAAFLVPVALVTAVVLTARSVLWAPLAIDGGMALGKALSIAWVSGRGQVWRLLRLGLTLGLPLLPVFVLEMTFLGDSWFATGVVGALYALATAHLYLSAPAIEARTASPSAGPPTQLDGKNQEDLNVPHVGTGWSKPFE